MSGEDDGAGWVRGKNGCAGSHTLVRYGFDDDDSLLWFGLGGGADAEARAGRIAWDWTCNDGMKEGGKADTIDAL